MRKDLLATYFINSAYYIILKGRFLRKERGGIGRKELKLCNPLNRTVKWCSWYGKQL